MKKILALILFNILLCKSTPSVGAALSFNSMWKGISITRFQITGYYQSKNIHYYGSLENFQSIRSIEFGLKHYFKNYETSSPFFSFAFNSISKIQQYTDNIKYIGPSGKIGYSIPFHIEINSLRHGIKIKNAKVVFSAGTGYMVMLNRDAIGEQFYFFNAEFLTDQKILK
tara:strand:- start:203 stop:712 length:510 start_codon:yes stop_codon:yes gene_type:complete